MKNTKLLIKNFITMFVGSVVLALAFTMFLIPSSLVTGGVGGLSIVVENLYGIEPSIFILIGNVILFAIGWLFMGNAFAIKTVLGTFIFPIAMYLTKGFTPITDDVLLNAIFGGVTAGIGLGIIFRQGASTGGMDIPPHILKKYFNVPLNIGVIFFDTPVIILGGFVFGFEAVLYALISMYIFSKVLDITIVGTNTNKALYIMTNYHDDIINIIHEKFDRGATLIHSKGSYTNQEKETILCVLKTREYVRLRREVLNVDPNAFLIIMNASEIHGEGFIEE